MILAFLQNLWVRYPDRVEAMLEGKSEEYRRDLLRHLLFHGGLTGRRIRSTFGDLCNSIVWEEATREIGKNSGSYFAADTKHIAKVIDELKPDVIITFGKLAGVAVAPFAGERKLICLPHPAARQRDVMDRLRSGAECLKSLLGEP